MITTLLAIIIIINIINNAVVVIVINDINDGDIMLDYYVIGALKATTEQEHCGQT